MRKHKLRPSILFFITLKAVLVQCLLSRHVSSQSQSQRRRVFFGLQSQVGDAGVLARVLSRGGGSHHGGGGGRFCRECRQGQSERRRGEHHVGRVRRQVRVQVVLRVSHGAVQLQLRLHLKGEGRHVAMTILRDGTHGWGGERKGERRGRTCVNFAVGWVQDHFHQRLLLWF